MARSKGMTARQRHMVHLANVAMYEINKRMSTAESLSDGTRALRMFSPKTFIQIASEREYGDRYRYSLKRMPQAVREGFGF